MANYTIADLSEKTNITNCYVELDDNSPRENKNYGFKTIVGSGNGLATLQNGKLHPSQTPEIRVATPTVVSSQAQMLALDAVVGSVAIRTDTNENFILSSLPASTFENWIVLNDKLGVTSVFGRSTPNIEAQHGDYTTDLVPEGSDPLRKYYTKARFDFDFANSIELIKNEENGILGLDNLKTAHAHDFKLIDPAQSLKAIYDNANQANWFVKLNNHGKIDSQYLPPAPTGYTDNDARNALAAPNFDKILGFKNTAADSASMLSNTANLYIDSSGNEYLQHKIGSTVRNRRFAMQETPVAFTSAFIASTNRNAKFHINNFFPSSYMNYHDGAPAIISANLENYDGAALRAPQDTLALVCSANLSGTNGNHVRHKVGAYSKSGSVTKTIYDIVMSNNTPDEGDNMPIISRLLSEGVVISAVKSSAPPNGQMFNGSLAFYTDSTENCYIVRAKKSSGSVTDINPMFKLTPSVPGLAGAGDGAMSFYNPTSINQRYVAMSNAAGILSACSPVIIPLIGSASGLSDSEMIKLPYGALDFFYTNEITTISAKMSRETIASIVDFLVRAGTGSPDTNNMFASQIRFYIEPDGSNYALYAKIKSPDNIIPNLTFKLATSI